MAEECSDDWTSLELGMDKGEASLPMLQPKAATAPPQSQMLLERPVSASSMDETTKMPKGKARTMGYWRSKTSASDASTTDYLAKLNRGMSWPPAPGRERKQYKVPLLAEGGEVEDQENNRVFGGIRTMVLVRCDLPTVQQTETLHLSILEQIKKYNKQSFVMAFVNSKSGGQIGAKLLQALDKNLGLPESGRALLGEVVDLSKKGEPGESIRRLAHRLKVHEDRQRMKISDSGEPSIEAKLLVCGGDGTVTWILTALEQCEELQGHLHKFPVGIVPLGTGNDLARSLGWGDRLQRVSHVLDYLRWVIAADTVVMDQWRVVLRPHNKLPQDHKLRTPGSHPQLVTDEKIRGEVRADLNWAFDEQVQEHARTPDDSLCSEVYLGYWQNYFSLGTDAEIAYAVDRARSTSSWGQCMFRRGLGKLVYVLSAFRLICCARRVSRTMSRVRAATKGVFGKSHGRPPSDTSPPPETPDHRVLVFLNINSFAAGMNINPSKRPARVVEPSPNDGNIEIIGANNIVSVSVLGTLGCNCLGGVNYLTSGEVAAFTSTESVAMQTDGEPWIMEGPCDVFIEPHRQVHMLRCPWDAQTWKGHVTKEFWDLSSSGDRQDVDHHHLRKERARNPDCHTVVKIDSSS